MGILPEQDPGHAIFNTWWQESFVLDKYQLASKPGLFFPLSLLTSGSFFLKESVKKLNAKNDLHTPLQSYHLAF